MRHFHFAAFAALGAIGLGLLACSDDSKTESTPLDAGSADFDTGVRPQEDSGSSTADSSTVTDTGAPEAAPPDLDFFTDFEGTLPAEIDPGTGLLTGTEGYSTLGPTGKTFATKFLRSQTANVVKVTLTNLPPHKTISIAFLFAAIDSLDGTGTFPAGDFFKVTVDGVSVFRESFFNAMDGQVQSYVPPTGGELARRIDLGFQGPGGYFTDSAYDMAVEPKFKNIAHTASTLKVEFTIEGEGNQMLDDESWAIDNLRITSAN